MNEATASLSNYKRGEASQVKHDKILTAKQAEFVNKELSTSNNTISIKKIVTANKSEENELDNAYQKALITGIENKVAHSDKKKSLVQMKEWSILSDHVKYVTSDGSETFNNSNIDQMNYRQEIYLYRELQEKELLNADVNFGGSPDKLKAEYLDVYEGVHAMVVSSDRFYEDTDLSTTYLGQIDMNRNREVKAEEKFPITA